MSAHGPAHAIARHIGIDVPEPPTDPEAPPLSVDPLYLGPGARIIGIVRDADGPVAGVSLTLAPDGGGRAVGPQERPRPTRSAADGTFAFEGVPVGAVFRLQAYTSGEYAQAVFGPYEIHGGKDLTDIAVVLSRGGSVTFRTVNPDGDTERPDHVRLGVRGEWARGDRIVATDEGFAIRRVTPGEHEIRIVVPGYVAWDGPAVRVRDGETVDLGEIALRAGGAIAGRVVDPDGEPVPRVRINGSWRGPDGAWSRAGDESAEDGTFLLGGIVGTETVRVDASHKYFMRHASEEIAVGTDDVELTLLRGGAIRGDVERADGGIPGKVRVTRFATADPESTDDPLRLQGAFPTTSDTNVEDGAFEITRVTEGRYTLSVRGPNSRSTRIEDVVVSEGGTVDIGRVVLDPGVTLLGEVVTGDGNLPVPAVSLEVEAPGALPFMTQGFDRPVAVISDPEGRFVINGLDPGTTTLKATHPKYSVAELRLTLEDGVEPEPVTVRMTQGGTITGTVRNDDGSPAAGNYLAIMVGFSPSDARAETAEDGTYRFDHVPPGAVQVARVIRGRSMPELRPATVREGETTVVDFGDPAPIVVTGSVLVGDEPIPGAQLMFHPTDAVLADPVTSRSDAEGRFEAGFRRPGTYTVIVTEFSPRGNMTAEIDVPDQSTAERNIVFASGTISGTVVDADGAPISLAQVVAHRPEADRTTPPFAVSEEDGTFRIHGVPPGTYLVVASAEGHTSETRLDVIVGPGEAVEDLNFTLDAGRVVRGIVVDPAGRPIAEAIVSVSVADAHTAGASVARTDVHGRFVSTAPGPGEVSVQAFAPGWALGRATGESANTAGEAPEITVRLTAGGMLTVRVVDSEDAPVVGSTLSVQPMLDEPIQVMMLVTQGAPIVTDANGTATVPNLPPATYEVNVQGRPDSEKVRVDVRDGEVATATLTVQSP